MSIRSTIERYTGLRSTTATPADQQRNLMQDLSWTIGGGLTTVGVGSGLRISTVYACIDTISKTIAALPSHLMRIQPDGDKIHDVTNPQYKLWSRSPYPNITIYQWKRQLITDYLLYGNGYAIIIRDGRTYRPVGYKNIDPWDMIPIRNGKHELYYHCYDQTYRGTYMPDDVIHIRDIGNGDVGLSKIALHATTIGKEKAASDFINSFYSNGMFLGGVIEYPKETSELTNQQIEDLRTNFKKYYGGIDKGAGVAIITGGGQLKQFRNEMPLSNAQYVESAKLNTVEICRIYSVPPPKVGHTEGTPYNSLESLNTDYWQNCILPIVTMMEQEINLKSYTESDPCYLTHNFESILVADTNSTGEYYTKLFRIGVLNRNEIRARMNLNRIVDGDIYMIEGNNMIPATQAGKGVQVNDAPAPM